MNAPPRPSRFEGLPGAAIRYTVALAIMASAVLVVAAWLERGSFEQFLDLGSLLLAALGAVSVVFPIRVHHGGDVQGFNLTTSVLLTIALLVDDPTALLIAALMVAAGYAVATRSWVKTLFNVSQLSIAGALALLAGAVVIGGPLDGDVLEPRVLAGLLVAAVVAAASSALLVSELIHHMGGGTRRELLRQVLAPGAWLAFGDFVIAILLTILADRSPVAIVLAVPMFAGLLLGFRGFASDRETARQAQLLHGTSRQLLDGAVDVRALDEAIDRLRELFGADRAYLATGGAEPPMWARAAIDRVQADGEAVLETRETCVLATPIRLDGRVIGVVVVGGRRGLEAWGPSDVDLLSTVAGEIAATLRTRRLLREIEQERARLVAEKGKLTDVLSSASDGIVVLDADGRVEACNPAMVALLGRETAEAGLHWQEVLHLEDDEGRPIREPGDHPLAAALSGERRVEHTSAALRRPDGDLRVVRCSAAPVVSDGAADGVVLVAVDVTRERELDQLRTDFIATVSHELRTPLTPLNGFLGVLREHGGTLDDDRRRMMVAAMEKQVGRLSDLIGDLLQVAEMERGLAHVHRELVDMDAAIAEIVELEAVAADDRGRVVLDVAPLEVVADQDAVRRILRALVSNGLKHTEGAVTLVTDHEDGAGVVRVRDQGPVIPPGSREVVFEAFRRLGDHLHRTQGPGLGLTVARSLAETLDGSVTLGTTPDGTGNEFVLRLPAAAERGRTIVELRRRGTA